MPEETPDATKHQVVTLYKEGKSYSQIRKATGLRHDATIVKIVTQAGLPKRKAKAPPAAPAAGTGAPTPATPPSGPPRPAGDGLRDFQPPPRAAPRGRAAPEQRAPAETFTCSGCEDTFQLDDGERLADITQCPGCGEAFE